MKELRCIGCKNKLGEAHSNFCSQFDGRRREVMKSNCKVKVLRSNLELIGDNWDNTRTLTKIVVKEDYVYQNIIQGEPQKCQLCDGDYPSHFDENNKIKNHIMVPQESKNAILKSGTYYISGFWADAVGLSTTLEGARKTRNDEFLPAMALKNFYVKKRKIVLEC